MTSFSSPQRHPRPSGPCGGLDRPALAAGAEHRRARLRRIEDAIELANGTDYGLIAGVGTRDTARAFRVSRRVRAGQVYINAYGAGGGIELPFGGTRKSGHGREKGFEALYEFSALKTLVIKHD